MKKVITPYQAEEFIKYCDKHTDRECAGNLWMTFGYGSKHDATEISIDLCDECADQLIDYLKKEFGKNFKQTDAKII